MLRPLPKGSGLRRMDTPLCLKRPNGSASSLPSSWLHEIFKENPQGGVKGSSVFVRISPLRVGKCPAWAAQP
jgi:hypothetical protein